MQDHIKFNAVQAKNLAFSNKMLLDEINHHTSVAALADQKEKLTDKINKLTADIETKKAVAAGPTGPEQVAAATEVPKLETSLKSVELELKAVEKPVDTEDDPIMSLTPDARMQVLAVRQ